MSVERYKEIRMRCLAARSGPWIAFVEGRDHTSGSSMIRIGEGDNRGEDLYLSGDSQAVPDADFDFIAHARHDIEFLLDEVERLQNMLK